jgi:hypothetical protein
VSTLAASLATDNLGGQEQFATDTVLEAYT